MTQELLDWHDAAVSKPDCDTTVLCWGADGFFCGYWDEDCWVACDTGGVVPGVTHWSVPDGPGDAAQAAHFHYIAGGEAP